MPPAQCGVCVISVDLGNSDAGKVAAGRQTAALAAETLARLNEAGWAATWSLGPAVDPAWIETARQAEAGHELAILCNLGWYSVDNHRGCFSQQLSDRLQAAQASGYSPTTLALPAG